MKDTPLNEAVRGAHTEAAKLLLAANASVLHTNTVGRGALEIAASLKSKPPELMKLIQEAAECEALALSSKAP